MASNLNVVAFSGNTHTPSKGRAVVEFVCQRLQSRHGIQSTLFDLANTDGELTAAVGAEGRFRNLVERLQSADALIVGTPVYKGSYSGLFKHVFDHVEPRSLVGRPVLLTATGGGVRHSLVPEHAMRPLFGFFEALIVPTAIYACESDFVDGVLATRPLLERIDMAVDQLFDLLARQGAPHQDTVTPHGTAWPGTVRRLESRCG